MKKLSIASFSLRGGREVNEDAVRSGMRTVTCPFAETMGGSRK